MKISKQVSAYMSALGKRSGKARLKKIAPEQRVLIARQAANSRWARRNQWWKETTLGLLDNRPLQMKDGEYYGFAPTDELLGINEVALRLQVPKSTIYELCRHRGRIQGKQLPHFKIGRLLKFRWSAVCEWMTELEKAGA